MTSPKPLPIFFMMALTSVTTIAQSPPPLNPGSNINASDTYLTADITIQSQTTISLPQAVHDNRTNTDTASMQVAPSSRQLHIEAGYDTSNHLVFNMYPTDPATDPTTTFASSLGKLQVLNGTVTVYDQAGNVMPTAIPQNPANPSTRSPAPPNPFSFLGAMPVSTVLEYFLTASPSQMASTMGGTLQTVQSGPPAVDQITLAMKRGGSMVMTYQNAGSVWTLQQMTLTPSLPNMQAHFTLQVANLKWIQNATGDANRARLASSLQTAPPNSNTTLQAPALFAANSLSPQGTAQSFSSAAQNVVFQHGIFSSKDTWSRMTGWLNPLYEFGDEVVPTLPSCVANPFGLSLCGIDRLSSQGTDLVNNLSSSAQNDFVLIGHSQGGLISRDVSQRRPDLSLGAITVDTPHLGALIDLTSREAAATELADLINSLSFAAGCTGPDDNLACALADFLANFSFVLVNFAVDSAIPATVDLEPVPFSGYLNSLNANTENFTRVGIAGHSNKRWVLMRLGGDFFSTPDGTFGGRNTALATEVLYDSLLACVVVAELSCDPDVAEFCANIAIGMDDIDSFWDNITAPGDASDGIVQGVSQSYNGATANYVIGGADSHVGATKSDKVRDQLINALDKQFFVPRTGCSFLLSPASTSFSGAGGTGSLAINTAINTPTSCSWSAVSNVPWITIPAATHGVGSGTVSYTVAPNPSKTASRTGTLTLSGLVFTLTQTPAPDFTLTVTPSSQSISTGGTTSYTISGSALNGFSGPVALSVAASPSGPSTSLSAGSITISPSGSTSSTLNVSAGSTPPGSYAITVTATGGGLTHSVAVALNINFPGFTVSIDPNQTVIYPGYLFQLTVHYSVSFQGGQSGNVSLSLSQDFCSTGGVYSLSQSRFTTPGSGTFNIWITDPGAASAYQCYRLTGTQNGVSHTVETDILVTEQ
jgi:pimeloyl-ACP methyl ester carboxylesterase